MHSKGIYSRIGILGGGQLGKMLAQAAADWNLDITVLDPVRDAPASCCAKQVLGDFRNYDDVMAFGADKDVLTIEIEDVSLEALTRLEQMGKAVYPSPASLALIQDKGSQKQFYADHQLPTAPFKIIDNPSEVTGLIAGGAIQFPFVHKLRKAGYDGRGVQVINDPSQLNQLFQAHSVIEQKVAIRHEIAVLTSRNTLGEIKVYDPVDMIFHPTANLLLRQDSPANLDQTLLSKAMDLATRLIKQMDIVGLLAVEMFVDEADQILINEVAPRPHNSGHHTIEASITSQYHQHLRCILGLPLGATDSTGYSSLINLLGEPGHTGPAHYTGMAAALALPGVYIHLYGKKETKPFRKMGHVTIVGRDKITVSESELYLSQHLKVITQTQ